MQFNSIFPVMGCRI